LPLAGLFRNKIAAKLHAKLFWNEWSRTFMTMMGSVGSSFEIPWIPQCKIPMYYPGPHKTSVVDQTVFCSDDDVTFKHASINSRILSFGCTWYSISRATHIRLRLVIIFCLTTALEFCSLIPNSY
jgi:hypothetical protein